MKNLFRTKHDNQLVIIDVEKETQKFTKAQIQSATEKGRDVATNRPPTTGEGLSKSPVSTIIRSSYSSKLVEFGVLFSKKIELLSTQYQQLLETFKSDSDFQTAQTELQNLKEEAAESLDEAVSQHEESIKDKREENKDLRADIKNNNLTLRGMKKYVLWPLYATGSIFLLLIVVGELSLNSESMEFSGLSQFKSLVVGSSIATASFLLGLFLASVVRKKEWLMKTKVLISLGIIAVVLGLFYTLGSIRFSMLSQTGSHSDLFDLTPWHFLLINLCFFLSIAFVKLFIFPNPEKVQNNANYRRLESQNFKLKAKLQANEKDIQNATSLKEQAKQKVKTNFAKPIQEAQAKIEKKVEEISTIVRNHNEILSRGTLFYRLINADFKTVTATFFNTVNLYRKDSVCVNVPPIEDLTNPFTQYRPIKTFEDIETVQVEPVHNRTSQSEPSEHTHTQETEPKQKSNKPEESEPLESQTDQKTSPTEDSKVEKSVYEPPVMSNYYWNAAQSSYSFKPKQ